MELKQHTATLAQMYVMGCQDAIPKVNTAALEAASVFITEIGNEPEVMLLQSVINPMLTVVRNCLASGDDDTVVGALDFVQNCVLLEQPLINEHLLVLHNFIGILI